MKKRMLVGLAMLMAVWILGACTADPEYLAYLLSRTQTAMALTPTYTPESGFRCNLFANEELSVVLYSIYPGDTSLTLYIDFSRRVIGLEDGRDDGLPWEYLVKIGEVESLGCDIIEGEAFVGRLYCVLPLPPEHRNAVKPFVFRVNGCDHDLLSIPRLSLTTEKVAGSGSGSNGNSESCGAAPQAGCNQDYEDWCNCKGGSFHCIGSDIAVCDLP